MDKSKTSFGISQLSNQTPEWANWIFRGYFIISKAFIGWAGMIGLFTPHQVFIILTTTNLLVDPIMYGFSKLFGIVPEPIDLNKNFVSDKQLDKDGGTNAIEKVIIPPEEIKAA